MKRFYNKYILLGTILLASVFGGLQAIGQTGVRTCPVITTYTTGDTVQVGSDVYEVYFSGCSGTGATFRTQLNPKTGTSGTTCTNVITPDWVLMNGSVAKTTGTPNANVDEFRNGATNNCWQTRSDRPIYIVVSGYESFAAYHASATADPKFRVDIQEWDGSTYGTAATTTAANSSTITRVALNSSKQYKITMYVSSASNFKQYAFSLKVPTVACTSPTLTHNITATSSTICNGSSTTIGLNSSESGVTYELLAGGSAIGGGVTAAGDAGGGAITFAAQSPSANTTYTVRSTTAGGYCQTAINGGTPSSQAITVNALPAISSQSTASASYAQNASASAISVSATGTATLTYQWYSSTNTTIGDGDDASLGGATSASYTPVTTAVGTLYYYCTVNSTTCATPVNSAISGAITVTSPNIAIADNGTQIATGNIVAGATKQALLSFTLANSGDGSGTVNQVDFTTTGTATGSDLTNFKLYYKSTNLLSTATELASISGAAAGAKSFTGLTQAIAAGATGYFWITCDVVSAPTNGRTVAVSATPTVTLASTSVSGTTSAGGTQTIQSPSIAIADNGTQISAGNTSSGATLQALLSFTLANTGAGAGTVNTVAFTTTGTAVNADFNAFKLYYYSSNTFGSASQIGTSITSSMDAGAHSFTGLTQAIAAGSTGYFWIVCDVASAPTTGHTVAVSATPTVTLAATSVSGTTSAGGTKTIITAPIVTTQAVSVIEASTSTGNGTITGTGGSAVTVSGVCWKTSTGPTTANSKTTDGATTATSYTSSMTGLTANTLYYLKAYATNAIGTSYGAEVSFTTRPGQPTIGGESSVTATGFTANWTAPAGQGAATFTYTLEYGTDNTFASKTTVSGIASGTISSAVTGLTASTTYYYRVKCNNTTGDGAYTAAYETVTTSAAGTAADYELLATTSNTTDLYKLPATTYTGGSGLTQITITEAVTSSDLATKSGNRCGWGETRYYISFASGGLMKIALPAGSTSYISKIEVDLASNSTSTLSPAGHYGYSTDPAAALTTYSNITDYSSLSYNTCGTLTITPSVGTLAVALGRGALGGVAAVGSEHLIFGIRIWLTASGNPPTVTTDATTNITTTTATGNGEITAVGDGVTSSGVCYKTTTGPTTSDTKTNTGGTAAAVFTGESISGLTANTKYYLKAYAIGTSGTAYGSEVTFTTLPGAPTVGAETSVTSTSFVANWTAPTQGSETCTYSVEVTTAGDTGYGTPVFTSSGISGTSVNVNTGLTLSTNYIYRVKCVNTTGSGAWSGNEAVTTAGATPEINVTQAGTNYLDGTSTYAYGAVTNASSADITFTIQNTGAGDLDISSTSVTGDAVFTRQTDPTGTIAAGGTGTITVRFTPTSSIAFTGTLTINSDDADEAVYTIALTGTGTADLSAPTGLASSSPTTSGFTLSYNTVAGASSGYEAKVCQIDATPSNILEITNAEIIAWTEFPAALVCTDFTNYTINYNQSTTQVDTEGTFTLKNLAVGSDAACGYIQLGKPAQTAQVPHPTITYWEGGNSDITGDAINDGGMIIFPEVASAGTLTINAAAISSTAGLLIEKSVDGGTTYTTVSTTALGTSTTNVTATINEMNPVIIRIRNVTSGSNNKWIRINSFSMTNYMECGTVEVIGTQGTASLNFTGLNPNTIYYYTIRSKAGATYSRWSTASAATTEITLPNPPTLNATSSVTSTGMTLNWAAPASAGNQTYTYTIEYGTASDYTGALSLTGISSGTLAQALTGLSKNTTYYYRVRCENASGVSTWATGNTPTLAEGPTVTTTTVSAVATTTASTGGNITDDGGDAITDMGLAYGTSANPTTGLDNPANTTGAFTSSLTGLTPNTKYYYRAYATNANGTSYGTESSFITQPNAPTVGAGSVATTDGFTANWSAPGTAGTATYTYTVEVSTNAADFTSPAATATAIASGTTLKAFTGLSSFVTYYYRVKCVNAEGSSEWSAVSAGYQTAAGGATVTTTPVTNITISGADGGGNATADGGDAITAKGLVYKTSSPVIATDNPTTDGGAGTGVFTSSISGLTANTKYYYRAYATNGNGTALGAELNFTTLPAAPVVGTGNTETGVGFTANWTAPAVVGTETYTYEVEVTATSGNYTTPAASYTGISSASLAQVVTGLSASSPYYYRVRATNSEGSGAWSTESAVVTTLAQKTLTITFTNGTVTANGIALTSGVAQAFSQNEEITLVATPASGYGFLRWVVEGVQNVADNPYTMTLVDNTTMTANFAGAACNTYDYDDVANLSTSNTSGNFTTDGSTWSVLVCRLNTSSTYSHSGNNSIRLNYVNGSLITPVIARPVSISFWARLYNTSYNANLRVYISTDGGTTYDATPIISESVTGSSWVQYSTSVSTTSTNVKFKVVNASSSLGGTSYDLVIDDMVICEGPDATAPTLSFSPSNGSTSVAIATTPTITSTEALYRFNTTTGALIAITAGSLSGMDGDTLATFLTLTKVSDGTPVAFTATIDGTGKIITATPTSSFAYITDFKLSIRNVGDANGNIIPTTMYTQFTTEVAPIAIIGVKEMSPYGALTDGEIINMGTIISQPNTTKTFKIYNTGNAALTFTQGLTTGTLFTVTTAPTSPLAAGDSTTFVITFTPVATGAFTDVYSINSNDATNPLFELNLQGGKAAFVLPYTYESGCTSPIISASAFKHDYTSLNDIPEEITLKNGSAVDEDHFFDHYSVFHVEGNCMPQGNSALRVGQDNNGLKVHLTNGCGQVTVKWCANGYRKIKISDNSGNVYELSPSYNVGGVCYTTASVLNVAGDMYVNIEFFGTDPALLTTVYFLEITPYNADLKSSARNILALSTTDNTENVRIYDDVVLVTVDAATDRSALATDLIQVSPFATISPAQGTTQNYSAGPVTYTVTAQNGLTKTYKVYVDAEITYSGNYADTVQVTVPMDSTDKIVEVIEISNSSCTVPVSGTGSAYTIHFLDIEDNPGTYLIGGTPLVCIGSTATYSITNAPAANNPTYTWTIGGAGSSAFTTIGSLTGPTLTLRAPDTLSTADLSLGISVDFGVGCAVVNGTATKTIDVTDQPPTAVDGLTASCATNGMLTIEANGSNDATTYNWNFTPSTTQVLIQNDSTIIINVGTSATNITATVNTQNGCGITENPTSYDVDYAQSASTWTGAVDDDWTNPLNWTGRVPQACTNVIIPDVSQAGVAYPTISAATACHYITFEPGAAVLGLQNLAYEKAFVQAELQRNRWYTMASPLKEMRSGDFGFMGAPLTQMTLFDEYNPDNSAYTANNWTKPFSSQSVDLDTINGFAFKLFTKSLNYPSASTTTTDEKTLTFPRLNSDSSLVESYIPFNSLTGKAYYANAVDLNKDDNLAYRFSAENGSNTIAFPITKTLETGLNLIGNPLMSHLSFANLKSHNAAIDNAVKFWNGTYYATLISDLNLWSIPGDTTGVLIAPMQAFIVNSPAGGTLSFAATDFVADVAKTSVLRSTKVPEDLMYVTVNNGSVTNAAAIAMRSAGANNLDSKDASKLFVANDAVAEVYTLAESKPLDINIFNKAPYTTPLGIRNAKKGNVTLNFKQVESFKDVDVYLLNTQTGENVNLKENPTYTFEANELYNEGKLFIEFRNASISTENENSLANNINIFVKDNNTIKVISNPSNLIRTITIIDETGRVILMQKEIDKAQHEIVMNNNSQVYIVKVATDFENKTEKVIIR